jgi:hypothetical protein
MRQRDLDRETAEDQHDEAEDQRLQPPHPLVLEPEDQEGVERGEDHAVEERDAEQQFQRDGRADQLGEIGRADRHLREEPQWIGDRLGEALATELGEVAAGGDADPGAQRLEQDRHQR